MLMRFLAATIALAMVCIPAPRAEELRFFRIATAATGGTYYPVGALIATAISAPPGSRPCAQGGPCGVPGLIASAIASEGSVANVAAIQENRVESGLVQGDVAALAQMGAAPDLRAIAALYTEAIHVVTRRDAGIATIGDLRGKRVSVDMAGSGTMVDAGIILAAAGLAPGDFTEARLNASDAARALSRNELDAFFFVGGYPAPAIAELAGQVEISLLPIPAELARQVAQDHPFLSESTIPPGTYQGQGEAVPTLSVAAIWATSARQPDDLILSITRALWSEPSARLLRTGRPMGRAIERSHALEGLGIPLHPGAAQFYREIGMLD